MLSTGCSGPEVRPAVKHPLVGFLRARITEQEIQYRTLLDTAILSPPVRRALTTALRDCRAKHQIIGIQEITLLDDEDTSWELMALADVYSSHPDWREEWAP